MITSANLAWFLSDSPIDRYEEQTHRDTRSRDQVPLDGTDRPIEGAPHIAQSISKRASPSAFHWSQIESPDYATFIANLRNIGCPETTIRDIIAADIHDTFHTMKHQLTPNRSDKFWTASYGSEYEDPALLALAEQEKNAVEVLLGAPPANANTSSSQELSLATAPLGELLASKREALTQWQQQFETARQEVLDRQEKRDLTDAEKNWLSQLDAQQSKALDHLLTPAEREDLDIRVSSTAEELRTSLAGTDVSENEFRSLVKLKQSYEEQVRVIAKDGKGDIGQAWESYLSASKTLLGEDRSHLIDSRAQELPLTSQQP